MNGAPLISVVVPVHNGERYLREALRTVLEQTYEPVELIVVDDGSTDDTGRVIASLGERLRAVRQAHAGTAAAVNRGVQLAAGSLLASLDADDLWSADKLSVQMQALRDHKGAELVFGLVHEFHSPELSVTERARIAAIPQPVRGIVRGTMLVRRDAFERVGPYDPRWRVGEFLDWYARALELGLRAVSVERVVLHRRVHASNQTLTVADRSDYARILAASLRRRRPRSRAALT